MKDIALKAIDCERLGFQVCFVNGHKEAEAKANARLVVEAFDLYMQEGKTPRQLEEENAKFRAALKEIQQIPNFDFGSDWEEIEKARAIASFALGE